MDFVHEPGRITLRSADEKVLAEVTFPEEAPGVVNVNHTFVDDSLRGQGIAGRLMDELVKVLRDKGLKAKLTCAYAVSWFGRNEEHSDLVYKEETEREKSL